MCKCIDAAIRRGFVVCESLYDEEELDFVDNGLVSMSIYLAKRKVRLGISHCPWCGVPIEVP